MSTSPAVLVPPAARAARVDVMRWLPDAAVTLITIGLIAWLPRPLSSDVAGQLWIAHRLREGARLYVDVAEVNPPLWFWLALPVDWLAERLRVAPEAVLLASCGAAVAASLAATGQLLAPMAAERRCPLLVYAAAVLLVGPMRDMGQREFIALVAALPYAALIAARHTGRAVPVRLALLVGAGAAIGFALKHYFLGVPLLLEAWLLLSLRHAWRPVRPETLALGTAGVAYALAVLLVTPAYLTDTLPELRLAYGAALTMPFARMILPAQALWMILVLAVLTQRRVLRDAPLSVALLLAGLAFAAAWWVQHKGWPYHAIPATGAFALALAALLTERWERLGPVMQRVAVAILPLPLALAAMPTHAPVSPENDIAPALTGLKRGDAVALISTEGFTAWPAAIEGGYRWVGRYGSFWMLGAVEARAADAAVARYGREVVRRTVADYRCAPPLRIVAVRPHHGGRAVDDPLGFFVKDEGFRQVFAHYRLVRRVGMFDAYQLVAPLAVVGEGCRPAR